MIIHQYIVVASKVIVVIGVLLVLLILGMNSCMHLLLPNEIQILEINEFSKNFNKEICYFIV